MPYHTVLYCTVPYRKYRTAPRRTVPYRTAPYCTRLSSRQRGRQSCTARDSSGLSLSAGVGSSASAGATGLYGTVRDSSGLALHLATTYRPPNGTAPPRAHNNTKQQHVQQQQHATAIYIPVATASPDILKNKGWCPGDGNLTEGRSTVSQERDNGVMEDDAFGPDNLPDPASVEDDAFGPDNPPMQTIGQSQYRSPMLKPPQEIPTDSAMNYMHGVPPNNP